MKKIISMILCVMLMATTAFASASDDAANSTPREEAIFDVSSLGIMQGFEDGTFREDEPVTRAQFAKIAMAALNLSSIEQCETGFSDVPSDHWASGYVKFATDIGLINGMGDGTFAPEESVTMIQAAKIMIGVLGREIEAKEKGGYPSGYLAVATDLSLFDYLEGATSEAMTRGDVAQLVANALDCYVVQSAYSSKGHYVISERTLRTNIERLDNCKKVYGIVTATRNSSLYGTSDLLGNRVEINGAAYKSTEDFTHLLGYNVIAYISSEKTDEIVAMQKYSNDETYVDASEISHIDNSVIRWYESDSLSKEKKADISNARVIYNGKYSEVLPTIYNGTYMLLSNDHSKDIDVIFVTEFESYVVDRTTSDTIYFKTGEKYRGKSAFKFITKNDDAEYDITDFEGNTLEVSDIKENMSFTICASSDEKLVKIYASDKKVTGTVTAVAGDKSYVEIDEVQYETAKSSNGEVILDVKIGDSADFLIDINGRIIDTAGDVTDDEQYAYVVSAKQQSGLSTDVKLQVIKSGTKEKITEIVNDTETVRYECYNKELTVLEFSSKVNADGESKTSSSLNPFDYVGKVIAYTPDADGKIRKFKSYDVESDKTTYQFNAKIPSIGGYVGRGAYFLDENTSILCVPEDADSEEDYLELVTLAHNTNYNIKPVIVDEETQKAKAVVVVADMDAESLKPFDNDVKVSIVWGVRASMIDGEASYKITMLTGEEIEEVYTKSSGAAHQAALELRKGDLIKYSLDSHDKLSKLEVVTSVQGLDEFYRAYENSPRETVYAMVNSISLNRISEMRNEIVDELTVVFKEDGTGQIVSYDLPKENGPTIYKYNKRTGDVSSATTDEIYSFEDVGSAATRVFMAVSNNDVQAFVIIEN